MIVPNGSRLYPELLRGVGTLVERWRETDPLASFVPDEWLESLGSKAATELEQVRARIEGTEILPPRWGRRPADTNRVHYTPSSSIKPVHTLEADTPNAIMIFSWPDNPGPISTIAHFFFPNDLGIHTSLRLRYPFPEATPQRETRLNTCCEMFAMAKRIGHSRRTTHLIERDGTDTFILNNRVVINPQHELFQVSGRNIAF